MRADGLSSATSRQWFLALSNAAEAKVLQHENFLHDCTSASSQQFITLRFEMQFLKEETSFFNKSISIDA